MKILIITPTYNSEKFITECMASVLSQTIGESEIVHIVKDGGSSDNTCGVIRNFLTRNMYEISSKRIVHYIERSKDNGMYEAINRGAEIGSEIEQMTNGKFDLVLWLNSDDRLASDFVVNISKYSVDAKSNWFVGRALDINEFGDVVTDAEHDQIQTEQLTAGDFNYRGGKWMRAESVAIGYDLFTQAGGLNSALKLAGDYELFVKLARIRAPIWVNIKVKEFRLHSQQLSKDLVKYEYERFSEFRKFNESRIEAFEIKGKTPRILFYPDYTSGNPYQTMMYHSMMVTGFQVFEKLEQYLSEKSNIEKFDVFHIQWLNDIMRRPREEVLLLVDKMKIKIKELIGYGKKIIFTVHNIGSHEAKNADLEKELTLFLFQVSTKVHVHHSIVSSQLLSFYGTLPWGRLVIAEHGPYKANSDAEIIDNLLLQFGLTRGAKYIVVPGQIRRYKNLELIVGLIEHMSSKFQDISIVLAGQFHPELCEKDKIRLRKRNVRLSPVRLDDSQYNLLVQNALFVFLSYKDISTSGSMFHAISNGAVVLAPMLGTIPAYIDEGKTGCLYSNDSIDSLYQGIERLIFLLDTVDHAEVKRNLKKANDRLSWSYLQHMLFSEQK